MRRMILAVLAPLALAGCASIHTPLDDGYQVGDLGDLRAQYCANADPYRRAVVLALMHQAGVPVPPRGACSDILSVIDLADLPEIDAPGAEQDRQRFEERVNGD